MSRVTTAVIPAAGFGTRFLPATKAQPKEMLTVVDKPVIQYVVEEAVASGITDIIIITGQNKRAIEDHFDRNFELETRLREQKKNAALKEVLNITKLANFIYIRQKEPLGDGQAILEAESILRGQPFAVMSGDDIIDSPRPLLKEMIDIYEEFNAPVVAATPVPKREIHRYGVIGGTKIRPGLLQLTNVIEKPTMKQAPSNLAIIVRYILNSEFLDELKKLSRQRGRTGQKELHTSDGMAAYIKRHAAYGHVSTGDWHDCGSKLGLIKAQVAYGLKRQEFSKDLTRYLRSSI